MTNVIPLIQPLDRSTIIEKLDIITGSETTAIAIIVLNGNDRVSMYTWGEIAEVVDAVDSALEALIDDLPPESYAH